MKYAARVMRAQTKSTTILDVGLPIVRAIGGGYPREGRHSAPTFRFRKEALGLPHVADNLACKLPTIPGSNSLAVPASRFEDNAGVPCLPRLWRLLQHNPAWIDGSAVEAITAGSC